MNANPIPSERRTGSEFVASEPTTAGDTAAKVILAICYANKQLGVSCYDEMQNCILCDGFNVSEEDIEHRVRIIKQNLSITLLLLHPKIVANQALLDMITSSLEGGEEEAAHYRFLAIKSASWNEGNAIDLITNCLTLKTPPQPNKFQPNRQQQQQQQHSRFCSTLDIVSSVVDLQCAPLVQSLGALLGFMQAKVFNLDNGRIHIAGVYPLPVQAFMRIDKSTLEALQVFSEEIHPNVIKGVGRSKEGFSLFGLFDRTNSLPGRAKLKEWMSKPFFDAGLIRDRQAGVELVVRHHMHHQSGLVRSIVAPMKHIHDIARLLLRIKKVEAVPSDWIKLHTSLLNAVKILEVIRMFIQQQETQLQHLLVQQAQRPLTCNTSSSSGTSSSSSSSSSRNSSSSSSGTEVERDVLYLRSLCGLVDIELVQQLWNRLDSTIDFEVSTSGSGAGPRITASSSGVSGGNGRGGQELYIRAGFDETLDSLRCTMDGLEQQLVAAAHLVLDTAPLIQHVAVEYVPQIGYLVAVANDEVHLLPQPHQGEGGGGGIEGGEEEEEEEEGGGGGRQQEQERGEGGYTSSSSSSSSSASYSPSSVFSFVYSHEHTSYFKHPIVYHMDDTIGDIKSVILDRQRSLMLQLEDAVLEAEPQLQHTALVLSQLDALISLGTIAVEQRLVKPDIVDQEPDGTGGTGLRDSNVLIIKQGRHLLQELAVDNFVSNDTLLTNEQNVALITGPNSSGKSVYLKQVGLICYLAHIGSFVPCERAVIGLTDQILTRIKSTESVSSNRSAFSIDLHQVSRMLSTNNSSFNSTGRTGRSSNRSLCLIDEFGKGTSPVDGISLLASVVRYFATHPQPQSSSSSSDGSSSGAGSGRGKALFALHFTEIVHPRILEESTHMKHINCFFMSSLSLRPRQQIEGQRHGHMEEEEKEKEEEEEESVQLFKLKRGIATSSEGLPCARRAGLPERTLARATEIRRCLQKGENIPCSCSNITSSSSFPPLVSASARDTATAATTATTTNSSSAVADTTSSSAAAVASSVVLGRGNENGDDDTNALRDARNRKLLRVFLQIDTAATDTRRTTAAGPAPSSTITNSNTTDTSNTTAVSSEYYSDTNMHSRSSLRALLDLL